MGKSLFGKPAQRNTSALKIKPRMPSLVKREVRLEDEDKGGDEPRAAAEQEDDTARMEYRGYEPRRYPPITLPPRIRPNPLLMPARLASRHPLLPPHRRNSRRSDGAVLCAGMTRQSSTRAERRTARKRGATRSRGGRSTSRSALRSLPSGVRGRARRRATPCNSCAWGFP